MNPLAATWDWFTTASNWSGPGGIPQRLWEHIQYSVITLVIAAAIALPIGLLVGHAHRGARPPSR